MKDFLLALPIVRNLLTVETKWNDWAFGCSFYRGDCTTYACGHREGQPSEFTVYLGPFDFWFMVNVFIIYKTDKYRYEDTFG